MMINWLLWLVLFLVGVFDCILYSKDFNNNYWNYGFVIGIIGIVGMVISLRII